MYTQHNFYIVVMLKYNIQAIKFIFLNVKRIRKRHIIQKKIKRK